MRKICSSLFWIIGLFGAILFVSCAQDKTGPAPADLVFKNGAVYTVDESRTWAEAVAIDDGRIVYVGGGRGVKPFVGRETEVVDLEGKMVLPGFHDSHVHLISGGIELGQCDLNGLKTREEIFKKIQDYTAQNPDAEWIVGSGWDLWIFPGANPTREELDSLVPDRPAYLSAADGHSAWVNSKALERAGITRETTDPEDGRIERDQTGLPSGTLREGAMGLVGDLIPELKAEDYLQGLRAGLELAHRYGITSIIEASANDKILEAYAALDRRGELTLRVLASLYVDPKKGVGQIPELMEKRETHQGRYLKATDAKIFVDGVIESQTAVLLKPYVGRPGYYGIPNLAPEELERLSVALDKAGFQIHIHAIGDGAVRMSLDALEAAQRANGKRDSRHHIVHLQLIHPDDISRFGELGVVANFQALWAYPDPYITQLAEPALGPERSRRMYPIGSVAKSGAVIAGGSDWSVSSMNPLDAIQVGVTRRAMDDAGGQSWLPEELVDLPTMIAAYTANGAYLSHQEKLTGSIETGKAADVIILDRNLFEVPPTAIHQAKVLLTLLDGREVYRDPSFR